MWGRLLRVPNLFTVPGDAVAGFLLAASGAWAPGVPGAALTVLLLYAAGLLLNDYYDREIDARERPGRPIPSGAVAPRTVVAVGGLLLVAGAAAGCCLGGWRAGIVSGVLALLVLGYDAGLKRVPVVGQVVMGGCRAGSVLVGGAFGGTVASAPVLLAAAIAWGYTTAVTLLAAEETSGRRPRAGAFAPPAVLMIAACAMAAVVRTVDVAALTAIAVMLVAVVEGCIAANRVRRGRIAVPPFIGWLIRVMIVSQTAWCIWALTPRDYSTTLLPLLAGAALLRLSADLSSRRLYGS